MMYRSHEYAGVEDMNAILGLVSASWQRDGPHNRFHIGDVYWYLGTQREDTSDQPYANIRLWTIDTGETIGFAWLEDAKVGDVLLHPDHRYRGIEEEMLEWLEERHRSSIQQQVDATSFQIGGYQDPGWQRLLTERGFAREEGSPGAPHFWRSLNTFEREAPPDGFVVRSVAGEHEATKRTMVARAAFASLDFQMPELHGAAGVRGSSMPDKTEIDQRTRIYKNVMRLSGYRRDLDIVAVTDNGEFAAFCTCWLDSENRVGEFEPVGCHPDFRRRGLARAVMHEGLRKLKTFGAESAVGLTNPLNSPSIRLFQSCGFQIVFTDPIYRKAFVR